MCFSASASFGAGVVLSVIGIVSIKKARGTSQIIFASIPLIFSVQQIAEGFLWLALSKPAYASMQLSATYIFLFFGRVVWPIYIPLSVFLLEKKDNRKLVLKMLVGLGALVSMYLAFCLLSYQVEAKIVGYHITYSQGYPIPLGKYCGLIYIIATIAPSFFSSIKRMWFLGIAILISYVMTKIFYTDYIVSVWCFFASAISIVVLIILYQIQKSNKSLVTI